MGHDAHFLERLDRVPRDELEYALSLYRNHEGVAHVLEKFKWPSGADRVALSLGAGDDGPFAIVTRAGNFVTCLGAGMSPAPHPVMPRSQVDALLAKYEEHRTRKSMLERESRDEEGGILARLWKRRSLFSREDFQAISFFTPLLTEPFFGMGLTTARDVMKRLPELAQSMRPGFRIDAALASRLEAVNSMAWAVGHLTLLAATAERQRLEAWAEKNMLDRFTLTKACALMLTAGIAFRGWWLTARLGKSRLPALKRELAEPADTDLFAFDNVASLTIIALRHRQTAAEIEKALTAAVAQDTGKRKAYAETALTVLAERDDHRASVLDAGRELFAAAMTKSSGAPFARENVSDDDALTMLLNSTFSLTTNNKDVEGFSLMMLPMIADAPASAFYFPRNVVKKVLTPWTAEQIGAWVQEYGFQRPAPVRVENKIGRNDPCSCGSGKKWKKCCGAA